MQPEEYGEIKVTSSPEGCRYVLHELRKVFDVVTTSPIMNHPENNKAHFYAKLTKKEGSQ